MTNQLINAFAQPLLPAPIISKSMSSYRASLRQAARGLWAGDLTISGFEGAMESAIFRAFEQAWQEGASVCGIKPEERTVEEAAELARLITAQVGYVPGAADWIDGNSKANGGKLKPVYSRIDGWATRYNETLSAAQQMACADQKYRWDWDILKEHCFDCRNLNGRVYRGSIWAKYGLRPGSSALACFGMGCGCKLTPTDQPVTPGRPPGLRGPARRRRRKELYGVG